MSLSPSQSSISAAPLDSGSEHVASTTSTPPTNFSDNISVASDGIKVETTPAPEAAAAAAATSTTETITAHTPPAPDSGRPRRARASLPVYNLAKLSGTSHGKRRANGEEPTSRKKRNVSGETLVDDAQPPRPATAGADTAVRDGITALDLDWSIGKLSTPGKKNKAASEIIPRATRSTASIIAEKSKAVLTKASVLGKRGRKAFETGVTKMTREMRRLQDTNEFTGIETKPVLHTIWAKGKLVTLEELKARANQPPPPKRAKVGPNGDKMPVEESAKDKKKEPVTEETIEVHTRKGRRTKRWLDRGLYAGQPAPATLADGLSTAVEKKKLAEIPELATTAPVNKTFPLPMFNGLRTMMNGRDFKLPFDVFNPLPPGQPKPEHWTKISKNRFVGDAAQHWKKSPHLSIDGSTCICKPEDGCTEDCQNRIMLYECDDKNCNIGREHCTNRAFADLAERKSGGGKYRIGVEVIKTSDRGYGIRSNRCFDAGQIIMEYTGEIITEEECDNRMNTKYKNNDCYYLMSFDQNMIIDATTGSIARFVNHSCKPNCRMIKWIVSGQPRMALFAGDDPIMTGDELTYDYNFDPFSAKNVQKCLCGEENCRGVLGPRPKDQKPPKTAKAETKGKGKGKGAKSKAKAKPKKTGIVVATKTKTRTVKTTKATKTTKTKVATKAVVAKITTKNKKTAAANSTLKAAMKSAVKAGKRKLADLTEDAEDDGSLAKKRKIKAPTGVKRTISNASSKVAKAAAKGAATVKKSVSTVKAKSTSAGKKKTAAKATTVRVSSHGRVIKASTKGRDSLQQTALSSRASSLTIVAAGIEGTPGPKTPKSPKSAKSVKTPRSAKSASASKSPRKALDIPRANSRIRLVSPEEATTITALAV
ncbi:hypothetical protein F5X68DRAFT_204579 [Plectosphaerella plurivora]|uniref:Histone-lysine N-methyltransferase ASH1L n=1 Tax=Plectosphaerella plurivora TaxID=936078 RepID=A0A9P8VE10_9PEZI|nr:hypothetical protein F5X68DRAFT_204579 [Plectosphaerella plurivora]